MTTGRALQWDVILPALAGIVLCLVAPGPVAAQPGRRAPDGDAQLREWLRTPTIGVASVHPRHQVGPRVGRRAGLEGVSLRVTESGRTRNIALDGTRTGARARAISAVHHLPSARRLVVHLDAEQDAAGLLIVDLAGDRVVDSVVGRDFTPSPDGRFWAFEEHASRTLAQWPHTETVYAVYDAAAPREANARPCPTADDRCRGQVLYLPDRLARCHAIAKQRGGSCLAADRQPIHVRRSPFSWLSPHELAWVDADRDRQVATLVYAALATGPAHVRAVALEPAALIDEVAVPPVRENWTVDRITRDRDPSRLWLHFRTRVPQIPRQRVGVRLH